ncbi:hypothetical protein AB0K43_20325 [Kitasatospora sp. NPDC049258]|uniref:hypothetical protein n=1 Tax=Kitasatospora sp. NPDC049258 TaxID=3155394 RepID=UPI00341F289F
MSENQVPDGPPAVAEQLGERYARVLTLVHRCALAVDAGRWAELDDVAGALSQAADELAAAASATTREPVAAEPRAVLSTVLGLEPPPTLFGALHRP